MKKYVMFQVALIIGIKFLTAQTQEVFTGLTYKYFVGTTEPDSTWNSPDYNDSSWKTGSGSIGYGDGDDSIVIDTTISVYIRYNMNTSASYIANIKGMVIFADFDDGFIAYINGKEILRVNMADSILHPTYLQTTCRSHEAEGYRFPHPIGRWAYKPLYGYYIDSATLAGCNLNKTVMLSFEVHNDSIKGSDLYFNFNYEFIDNNYNLSFEDAFGRFRAVIPVDSSPLPILKIETDEFGVDTTDAIAHLGVINNSSDGYNKPGDPFTDYDGRIRLKIHGSASRMYPKKSYKFETQDSLGENNNVSLLGMPPENDWMLISEYSDKTLINDRLTYDLGRATGAYAPRSRYCEVILNGIDQGIYCLNEEIKRDKNRVDITKLKPEDSTGVDLTGGYLFRLAGYLTIEVRYPKPENITQKQNQYINALFDSCSNALEGNYILNPERGYKKYLDINNLADYLIISELTKNVDAYSGSFYFYKDRDDISNKIFLGPLWDYDNAYATGVWNPIADYTGWNYDKSNLVFKIANVMKDTAFRRFFADKWFSYRKRILDLDSIYDRIDNQVNEMGTAVDRNYRIWQELPYVFYPDKYDKDSVTTYAGNIERLKTWIAKRISWMDNTIAQFYDNPSEIFLTKNDNQGTDKIICFPNPFRSVLSVILNQESPGDIRIEILDITGRICRQYKKGWTGTGTTEIRLDETENLKSGFYILNVYRNGSLFTSQKIIKME